MEREKWADVSKFIAIFFMVWAHAGLETEIRCFIYVFHMPLFFFVSGYFEKESNLNYWLSLEKSFRSLMIPYFCFSIFAISYCWNFPYRHPEVYPGINSVEDFFIAAFKGLFLMDDSVSYRYFMPCGPLWFLVALFIDKFLFLSINRIISKMERYKTLFWGVVVFLSLFSFQKLSFVKCFSVDSAIMGFSLYVTGFLFHRYNLMKYVRDKCWIIFPLALLYTMFFATKNGIIDMDGGHTGNSVLMFYVNALIGIMMVFSFSIMITQKLNVDKTLVFLGQNTLIILGVHILFIVILKVLYTILGIPFVFYTTIPLAIIVILLCVPMIHLINNKFPFIIGRFYLK